VWASTLAGATSTRRHCTRRHKEDEFCGFTESARAVAGRPARRARRCSKQSPSAERTAADAARWEEDLRGRQAGRPLSPGSSMASYKLEKGWQGRLAPHSSGDTASQERYPREFIGGNDFGQGNLCGCPGTSLFSEMSLCFSCNSLSSLMSVSGIKNVTLTYRPGISARDRRPHVTLEGSRALKQVSIGRDRR